MNSLEARYNEPLPAPGCGYHGDLMSKANLAAILGMDPQDAFNDLRRRTPQGNRSISDREISDAIQKAYREIQSGTFIPRPRPAPVFQDGKAALQRIIEQGTISDEADLWECSPIRLWEAP